MFLQFPDNFIWGTSTAAAQIETAYDHEWKGLRSKDGYIFDRTSDHEKRREEDITYITGLGNAYRMGLDWSRLQKGPLETFDPEVVKEYRMFISKLRARNMYIMMVIHHFTNPNWFAKAGSWETDKTLPLFLDYVKQLVDHFGDLVDNWNTFNEPAVYMFNAFLLGNFPPQKKSLWTFRKVLKNMSRAHRLSIPLIKEKYPDAPIGISKNTVIFHPENWLGKIPAKIADKVFMDVVADHFIEGLDYLGVSYYAKIPFTPTPITEIDHPGKLAEMGRKHDMMWEYFPEGMGINVKRYWKKYGKPIIITESGIATNDCKVRISSIKDYLKVLHDCMREGVDLRGYFHWSTMDNFEWNLGPTYRFGLVRVDFETGDRTLKDSGLFYQQVVVDNGVEV